MFGVQRRMLWWGAGVALACAGLLAWRASMFGPPLHRMPDTALRRYLERHPGDERAHRELAFRLENTAAPKQALAELRTVLLLQPQLSGARVQAARLLERQGRAGVARQVLLEGSAGVVDPAVEAALLAQQGREKEARARWEDAVRLHREDAECWSRLAESRAAGGDAAGAVGAARTAVRLAPQAARPHLLLAESARQAGDLSLAAEAAGEAVRLAPDQAGHVFTWARTLKDREGPTAAVLAALRRAVDLDPRQPVYRYTLAAALLEREEWSAALRELNRAQEDLEQAPVPSPESWRTWEAWLAQHKAIRFSLWRALRQLKQPARAAAHRRRFEQLGAYHDRTRRLWVNVRSLPTTGRSGRSWTRCTAPPGLPTRCLASG